MKSPNPLSALMTILQGFRTFEFKWQATVERYFLEEEFHTAFGRLVEHNIFQQHTPSVAVLVPSSSSMAAVLKALTPLPWKSNWSSTDLCECLHPLMLRYAKCLYCETLSAHVASLKSSTYINIALGRFLHYK